MCSPNARDVSAAPWLSAMIWAYCGLAYAPVITMTSAVMVQTTTVSMNGSSSATMPSRTGYGVRAAEWAIAAEPAPASLENAARRNPCTSTPMKPP